MQTIIFLFLFIAFITHIAITMPVAPIQLPHLAYITIPEDRSSNSESSGENASVQRPLATAASAHLGYARTFGSMGLGALGFRGYAGSREAGSSYGASSSLSNLFRAGNGYQSYGWYGNSPGMSSYGGGNYGSRYSGGGIGGSIGYTSGTDSRLGGGGGWRG